MEITSQFPLILNVSFFGGLHKKDSATENGNFENSTSHKLKM